jgi:multidrug efflux pump
MENDIYFQIGLVVLIGLAAKNAILIAEFAMQGMLEGKSAAEAAPRPRGCASGRS